MRLRWIWILGLVASLVAVLLIARPGRADRVESRTRELHAQARARVAPRPVLRGESSPGSAWEEYRRALSLAGKDPDLYQLDARELRREVLDAILRRHRGTLQHLRDGARRAEGQFPFDWTLGYSADAPSLEPANRLAILVRQQARRSAQQGRGLEAAQLLLDLAQFARDHAENSFLIAVCIGTCIWEVVYEELRRLLMDRQLAGSDAARIEAELEILERSWPPIGPAFLNERLALGYGYEFSDDPLLFPVEKDRWSRWRAIVSPPRWKLEEALDTIDRAVQRAASASELPWPEAEASLEQLTREMDSSDNQYVQNFCPPMRNVVAMVRGIVAQIRVLRVAARFAATGEVLDLENPFGGRGSVSRSQGRLLIDMTGPEPCTLEVPGP